MNFLADNANLVLNIIWATFFFMTGACVGSFLNVCIIRIPKGESIIRPASHCACGAAIKWYNNIPILSWFILRGKAPCCGRKFSFRYAFIEILCAVLFLLCFLNIQSPASYVAMLFCSLMIMACFIDLDTMYLPDFLTAGGAFLGIVLSVIVPQIHFGFDENAPYILSVIRGGYSSILGMIVGAGVVCLLRYAAEIAMGKEAMGEGDIILTAMIGSFCGWQGAMFAVFGGSVIGAVLLLPMYPFIKKKNEDLAVPFGPWLALGGVLYMLFLSGMVKEYFEGVQKIIS